MPNVLAINSSITPDSVSRLLVEDVLSALGQAGGLSVTRRDLGAEPVPHLTPVTLAGVRGVPQSEAELSTRALSDALIAELRAADIVVLGSPMYNFGVATPLRAWFDHVIRAGETFSYDSGAPKGLITGKRVIVVESRGGHYSATPNAPADFQEPYLRHLLNFMGMTDLAFIRAEGVAFGPEARMEALEGARSDIATLVRRFNTAA